MSLKPINTIDEVIAVLEEMIHEAHSIIKPGRFAAFILGVIRLTELGTVSEKIRKLKKLAI